MKKPGHRSGTKERIGEKLKAGEKYGVERRKNRKGGYVDLVKLGLAKEYTKEAEKARNLHPDFIEKTGYGTGEGILGWNCRHSIGTWIDGVSKNNYEKIDTEENKKAYDLQQAQRKLERTIRKWKIQKIRAAETGWNCKIMFLVSV